MTTQSVCALDEKQIASEDEEEMQPLSLVFLGPLSPDLEATILQWLVLGDLATMCTLNRTCRMGVHFFMKHYFDGPLEVMCGRVDDDSRRRHLHLVLMSQSLHTFTIVPPLRSHGPELFDNSLDLLVILSNRLSIRRLCLSAASLSLYIRWFDEDHKVEVESKGKYKGKETKGPLVLPCLESITFVYHHSRVESYWSPIVTTFLPLHPNLIQWELPFASPGLQDALLASPHFCGNHLLRESRRSCGHHTVCAVRTLFATTCSTLGQ